MPDLTGARFEPQTSHSRDERVTARPKSGLIYCRDFNFFLIFMTKLFNVFFILPFLTRFCDGVEEKFLHYFVTVNDYSILKLLSQIAYYYYIKVFTTI